MDQTVSTCTYCSDGCQLSVGSRGGEIHRIVARDRYVNGHNGEFLCVKGRFAHGFVNSKDRIKTPMIRYQKGGKLIPTTWDEAIGFVANKLQASSSTGVVSSSRLTNESVFTLKRFATEALKTENYAVSDGFDLAPIFDNLSVPLATHKDIRFAKTILQIGGDPSEDQPFTAKQMRQAIRNNGAKFILVNTQPTQMIAQASQFVHINPNSFDAFAVSFADAATDTLLTKLGIEQTEFDDLLKTVGETEGDLIVMFGGDLSPEARAVLANSIGKFGSDARHVLLHPLAAYNNSVGANDMMAGKKRLEDVLRNSSSLLIGGSLSEENAKLLAGKDFVVVQELFETATTDYADVILPAASFAESDGTYTNNDGLVQRVRQSIDPRHQSKQDWMITTLIARQMGADFGSGLASTGVFKSIADNVPAYKDLRYPNLKDESRPVQVKHAIYETRDMSSEIGALNQRIEALPDQAEKNTEALPYWAKLHQVTTMTGKTPQFHLLASGNPKPENLLVSPLVQFNLDGTPKVEEMAEAAAVGAKDRLDDKETVPQRVVLK
jgi:NADH-quinone oxidoreductase subunit G